MNESDRNISDQTKALIEATVAPNTIKAYQHVIQQFEIWLDGRPPNDSSLANYITELYQDGKSPATINKIVAAVKWGAKNHGLRTRGFSFEITEKTLVGIRREGKNRGRGQVEGITWDMVKQICALAEADNTVAGLRDSALIRLMSDCLLRISEAVAVDVADVDSVLTIHRSKTDSETGGLPDGTLYIGDPTRQMIKRYCEAGDITTGALFRRIRRGDNITSGRLSVQGARNAIKHRAQRGWGRRFHLWTLSSCWFCCIACSSGGVCCGYASRGAMEIPSDASALRTRRVGRTRRNCTLQVWKM